MENVYIILNKPVGYSTQPGVSLSITELLDRAHCVSHNDQPVPQNLQILHSLDTESEGLVFGTTDAELAEKKFTEYEFEITIDQYLSKQAINILEKGMTIEETFIPGVDIVEEKHKGKRSVVQLLSSSCNDRDLVRMFETIGYHVTTTRLIRMDSIKLGVLSIGKWKYISKEVIK